MVVDGGGAAVRRALYPLIAEKKATGGLQAPETYLGYSQSKKAASRPFTGLLGASSERGLR